MEVIKLNGDARIYYDIEDKIIGRTPTESNVKPNGSDNSLYMGLTTNDTMKKVICSILNKNSISDFSNKTFRLSFYGESVEVKTNINYNNHLQFKIVGNGQMYTMKRKYERYIGRKIDYKELIIFLDFANYEIYFEEKSSYNNHIDKLKIKNAKREIDKVIKKAKRECAKNNIENINAYIETMLSVRNNSIQKKFRKDLFIEFDNKCAICDINKKELLIASHIIPYSKCKDVKQMIDHNNGLLLCSMHDCLFDKNLISFNEKTGKIEIVNNSKLNRKLFDLLNIDSNISLNSKHMNKKRKYYLSKHHIK